MAFNFEPPSFEDTFEMIPPEVSDYPSKRRRSEAKQPFSSPSASIRESKTKQIPGVVQHTRWVAIAAVLCLGASLVLFGRASSLGTVEELRLEIQKNMESLRSEVQLELRANLLAAATVQTAAKERAIEIDNGLLKTNKDRNSEHLGTEHVLSTTESENPMKSPSPPLSSSKDDLNDGFGRLQPTEIVLYLGRMRDSILCHLQTMYAALITFDWTQKQTEILYQLQSIHVAARTLWDSIKNTILRQLEPIYATIRQHQQSFHATFITCSNWAQNNTLLRGIEFANQHPLEFSVWCIVLLFLLYNCYRCCRVPIADRRDDNGEVTNKIQSDEDEPGREDEDDSKLDPEERVHDVIMEHMFEDSMAAAKATWPLLPRTYTGGNRSTNTNTNTNTNTTTHHRAATAKKQRPSPRLPPVAQRNTSISKEERRRRARANTKEFAARDKQRLKSAAGAKSKVSSSPTPRKATSKVSSSTTPRKAMSNEERRRRARINAREFAAKDKQKLASATGARASPSPAVPPTWTSKRARLNQARANAKLYGEQDRQRLAQAAGRHVLRR